MSEKVVLTQEQADAIRTLRNAGVAVNLLDLRGPLSELKVQDVFKALQGFYEVQKPKFQAGDFIFNERTKVLVKLSEQSAALKNNGYWDIQNVRHATKEEIFWLHELGRDQVPGLVAGDYVVFKGGDRLYIDSEDSAEASNVLYDTQIVGIYPAESFKPFRKEAE